MIINKFSQLAIEKSSFKAENIDYRTKKASPMFPLSFVLSLSFNFLIFSTFKKMLNIQCVNARFIIFSKIVCFWIKCINFTNRAGKVWLGESVSERKCEKQECFISRAFFTTLSSLTALIKVNCNETDTN